jgi:hypothetical protein
MYILRCVQLRCVTLHYVTVTLCDFTLCSNTVFLVKPMSERKLLSHQNQSMSICVAIHREENETEIEGGNLRPGLRSKDLRLKTSEKKD